MFKKQISKLFKFDWRPKIRKLKESENFKEIKNYMTMQQQKELFIFCDLIYNVENFEDHFIVIYFLTESKNFWQYLDRFWQNPVIRMIINSETVFDF